MISEQFTVEGVVFFRWKVGAGVHCSNWRRNQWVLYNVLHVDLSVQLAEELAVKIRIVSHVSSENEHKLDGGGKLTEH